MKYETDDYLAHFGIKGMRWGIRRFQNEDGTLTAAGKERYGSDDGGEKRSEQSKSEQAEPSSASWKRDTKGVSDQELRERLNRLQMETQYKRMMSELYDPPRNNNQPQQQQKQNNNNQQKKKEHPILKQVLVTTAVTAASLVFKNYLQGKTDNFFIDKYEKDGKMTPNVFAALTRKSQQDKMKEQLFGDQLSRHASRTLKDSPLNYAGKHMGSGAEKASEAAKEAVSDYVSKHASNTVKNTVSDYVGKHAAGNAIKSVTERISQKTSTPVKDISIRSIPKFKSSQHGVVDAYRWWKKTRS